MTRDSRFDKLEQARPRSDEAKPGEPKHLTRFEEASPHAPLGAPGPSPADEPGLVAPFANEVVVAPLKRFEADGGAGLHLDRDALGELPMLRCPACQRDSSKWDRACIYCQTSLESPEAVAFNLQLVEAQRLAQDAERERAADAREAMMRAHADEQAEVILRKAREEAAAASLQRRLLAVPVALGCLLLVFAVGSWPAKFFFFLGFAVSSALVVPKEAWARWASARRPKG